MPLFTLILFYGLVESQHQMLHKHKYLTWSPYSLCEKCTFKHKLCINGKKPIWGQETSVFLVPIKMCDLLYKGNTFHSSKDLTAFQWPDGLISPGNVKTGEGKKMHELNHQGDWCGAAKRCSSFQSTVCWWDEGFCHGVYNEAAVKKKKKDKQRLLSQRHRFVLKRPLKAGEWIKNGVIMTNE